MQLNIVLVEPEIPQNTGNIARTCAATGARLHLVKPLGFSVQDKYLKRAGLDYWNDVEIIYHRNYHAFNEQYPQAPFYYVTTKAERVYSEVSYPDECFFIFGKETKGLPEELLLENYHACVRIPMRPVIRSLNLANSVAVITYEFFRQKSFSDFQLQGFLKHP
ncbi:MAG: tRNA (uridine(34)/cytosine(34)/5-carboxymethylaminomethyluridine(34)-2'-O)-methyltransferase TrmL [Ruminiclostridium sp.]|jgi:tRNA (cytidine/uridine-2'-O-)-methyltransferase|nr:tRNA (uridine(34)/cytosine(34)/5-carboxymethylaminomethyluridine(34)-2'-O)-methyltransferase TrmL [Ruminiclostridium sp.]